VAVDLREVTDSRTCAPTAQFSLCVTHLQATFGRELWGLVRRFGTPVSGGPAELSLRFAIVALEAPYDPAEGSHAVLRWQLELIDLASGAALVQLAETTVGTEPLLFSGFGPMANGDTVIQSVTTAVLDRIAGALSTWLNSRATPTPPAPALDGVGPGPLVPPSGDPPT